MFRLTLALSSKQYSQYVITKTSTGIVGIPVHQNPIRALLAVNQEILELAKEVLPEGIAYRGNVEAVAKFRMKVSFSFGGWVWGKLGGH